MSDGDAFNVWCPADVEEFEEEKYRREKRKENRKKMVSCLLFTSSSFLGNNHTTVVSRLAVTVRNLPFVFPSLPSLCCVAIARSVACNVARS